METRANYVWVGAVSLVLLALLAGAIVWIARLAEGSRSEYDILFNQSVEGLANGSSVTFAGVPVGQVSQIKLWPQDPEFVRVRIRVDDEVPILVGTTATVQASFTGISTILLDGAVKDAPPITCETTACPDGVPVIPPRPGGFGEILANAPLLLDRLATLSERLTQVFDEENQENLAGILENTNRLSKTLADSGPQIQGTLAELEVTMREAGEALDAFEKATLSADKLINEQGAELTEELRATLRSANVAAQTLSATLEDTRPAARQLSQSTLPTADATLRDLRATSKALRKITEKIENQGAGALIGGQTLPDYEP